MADPVQAWHDEHMYFRRLLRVLQDEVDAFATGQAPNYALMLDIIGYLRDWSDQFHHPREDEVFRRLAQYRPDLAATIARLQQEHRVIARAGEALRQLLEEVQADAVVPRADVEVAAATYLVYYGNHITTEEEDVLPAAARVLQPHDWLAAKDAAPGAQDPLRVAAPGQRFHDLRRRIAVEAG